MPGFLIGCKDIQGFYTEKKCIHTQILSKLLQCLLCTIYDHIRFINVVNKHISFVHKYYV